MFSRAAWNLVYTSAAREGKSFAYVFSLGKQLGLPSYRRAVMLGDYNISRGWEITQSWFANYPKERTVQEGLLSPGWGDQKEKYMYRVQLLGTSRVTGLVRTQNVTIHSDTLLSSNQLQDAALDQYGGSYAEEAYALDVENASALGGFVRPS